MPPRRIALPPETPAQRAARLTPRLNTDKEPDGPPSFYRTIPLLHAHTAEIATVQAVIRIVRDELHMNPVNYGFFRAITPEEAARRAERGGTDVWQDSSVQLFGYAKHLARSVHVGLGRSCWELARTTAHEMRHLYQFYCSKVPDDSHLPYEERESERDAQYYAADFLRRNWWRIEGEVASDIDADSFERRMALVCKPVID